MHNTKTKNQIPMGIRKETSQKRKENKNNMANIETLNLTEKGIMAYEELDPYSTESGELVDKTKAKIGKQTLAKIKKINLALGNGILS